MELSTQQVKAQLEQVVKELNSSVSGIHYELEVISGTYHIYPVFETLPRPSEKEENIML